MTATVGVDKAYVAGKSAYRNGDNYQDYPDDYTETEISVWQQGFDDQCEIDERIL